MHTSPVLCSVFNDDFTLFLETAHLWYHSTALDTRLVPTVLAVVDTNAASDSQMDSNLRYFGWEAASIYTYNVKATLLN